MLFAGLCILILNTGLGRKKGDEHFFISCVQHIIQTNLEL